MEIREMIYMMLDDDRLVLNTRTLEEAEEFVETCKDILSMEGLLEEEQEEMLDELTGNICYSIYGEETCFTLEFGILEHADIAYFEEDFKDYNIITLESSLLEIE